MVFEPNKYYKHKTGAFLHTFTMVDTTLHGEGLMSETNDPIFPYYPVGITEDNSANWIECTKAEWLSNFEKNDPLTVFKEEEGAVKDHE